MAALPGKVIDMFPPYAHIHLQLSSKAGKLQIFSCPPGDHGPVITGIQGIGVRTPIAAAVADATVGFAIERQTPKGFMLTIGAKSIMFAIGIFWHIGLMPTTVKGTGAAPIVHRSKAPFVTNFPIIVS